MTHRSPLLPRRASRRAAVAALLAALCAVLGSASLVDLPTAHAASRSGAPAPSASDDLSWSVTPADNGQGAGRANYTYAVEPGERIADAVVVTNRSAAPLRLTLYGTDAFTTSSGHIDLLTADDPATGLGTWLTFRQPDLQLEPGESGTVPFTLQVPDDATPGDHSGGVVTSLAQQVGDSALTVDRRLALRMHARVAGALAPGLEVSGLGVTTDLTANPVGTVTSTVRYRLTNTGSARVVPTETVTVTGPGGIAGRTTSAELEEVLPGSTVERVVEVSGVRPLGPVEAAVRVDGLVVGIGGGGVTSASDSASGWAVPLALLSLVVLAGTGAVVVPLVRSRRARAVRTSQLGTPTADAARLGSGAAT